MCKASARLDKLDIRHLVRVLPLYFYFMIIDEYAYLVCDFGVYRILIHIMLTLTEMVIIKIIYLYSHRCNG